MPGAHDEKLIAEKYALNYPCRPLDTRRWKRRWNGAALVVGIALGAGIYLYQGRAAFWAGAVSPSHASFGMDCQKCHTSSWQAAWRLVSLDSNRHSVSNTACQECHNVGDHHPRLGEAEPSCASCHQEHRPDSSLLAVGDASCTACHADLKSAPGNELRFVAKILSFDEGPQGHPEFSLLRAEEVSQEHGAWQVATLADNAWHDTGGVLFNHKLHLSAEGVLDADRKTVQLTCADCHEPEPDGVGMKAILYEQHCASCHPLRLAGNLAGLGDLPHETPELVRGVIRERIAKLQPTDKPQLDLPAIRRLPAPTVASGEQAASVDALIAAANHAVFGLEAKGLCRKCHHVEIVEGEWHVPMVNPAFTIVGQLQDRPMIPGRWFAHGRFDHGRHLTIACTDCHPAAASSETADILLPGIANCRQCHGSAPTQLSQGVAADCTMCHDYHGRTSHKLVEAAP